MAKKKRVKKEPTIEFAIRAMCGCNLTESESLAAKMTAKERKLVLDAYKHRKGRQVLTKIRQRIAMAGKRKGATPDEKPAATDVTDDASGTKNDTDVGVKTETTPL